MPEAEDTNRHGYPGLVVSCLHLAAIWSFAAVQPTYDLLSSGEAFALFRLTPAEIVAFSTALLVLPILALGISEWLAGLWSTAARWRLHLLFVGGLIGLFVGHLIKEVDYDAGLAIFAICLPIAAAGTALYVRLSAIRSFFSVLSAAPLVFLLLFLLNTPVKLLVNPEDASTPSSAEQAGTPVVLVVFDEFPLLSLVDRSGNIDDSTYPGFGHLQRTSTWYPRATAISDYTHEAIPALLGGKMPEGDRPPSWRAFQDTILTSANGTWSHEIFPMCDPASCEASGARDIDGGLFGYLPDLARITFNSFAPTTVVNRMPGRAVSDPPVDGFGQIASELGSDDPPSVFFVHELLPHSPFRFLPSGKTITPTTTCCARDLFPDQVDRPNLGVRVANSDLLTEDRRLVLAWKQAHLLQVGFADRIIQRLISDLKRSHVYDEAMVVVTADHGASFTAGLSSRRLSSGNEAEVLGVPLFVKYPEQQGGVVDRSHVRNFDIAPTVAEVLGTQLPDDIDAVPLTDSSSDRDAITAYRALDGDIFEISPTEFDAQFDALALRQDRMFGPGKKGIQVFSMGPAPELSGRRVTGEAHESDLNAVVDSREIYDDVNLSLDTLPVRVSGSIEGATSEEVEAVAVALNGRVAATGWTFPSSGELKFLVLIPPRVLRSGANDVEIHVLDPKSKQLTAVGSG